MKDFFANISISILFFGPTIACVIMGLVNWSNGEWGAGLIDIIVAGMPIVNIGYLIMHLIA